MDIFSQKKFLLRLVIILIVLNLALIGFFWWRSSQDGKPPGPPGAGQQELSGILKKELNLSEKQTADFNTIRAEFFEKEKILSEIIRSKRDSMNMMMFSENANDSLLKQLAAGVSSNEYKMELLRIEQAAKLRELCKPEQLKKLNSLIKEVRDYLKPQVDKK